jgi:hypothetical protein
LTMYRWSLLRVWSSARVARMVGKVRWSS